jgi:hypothetical protein
VSSIYIVMTVAQEYMRNSALEKESGNRLPEFLQALPLWPEAAGVWIREKPVPSKEALR